MNLTSFLHEDKEIIKKLFPLWVIIQLIKLQVAKQNISNKLASCSSVLISSIFLFTYIYQIYWPWQSPWTVLLLFFLRRSPRPRWHFLSVNTDRNISEHFVLQIVLGLLHMIKVWMMLLHKLSPRQPVYRHRSWMRLLKQKQILGRPQWDTVPI